MFDDIGGKIQGLAKVICWIGIIICIIIGIVLISDDEAGIGFAVIIVGSLLSWVSSFTLYGFGELVENSSVIRYELQSKKNTSPASTNMGKDPYAAAAEAAEKRSGSDGGKTWTCPYCFAKNPTGSERCKNSGSPKG